MFDQENLRKYLIGAFAVLALCSGFLRLILIRLIAEIAFKVGSRVGEEVYAKKWDQPISFHDARDSSGICIATAKSTTVITDGLADSRHSKLECDPNFGLTSVVIFIDPLIAGYFSFPLAYIYWLFFFYSKPKINKSGSIVAQKSNQLIQTVKENTILLEKYYCTTSKIE